MDSVAGKEKEFTDEDWERIKGFCQVQCTGEEIAGYFEIDYDTLNKRIKEKYLFGFSDFFKRYSAPGLMSIRSKQFELARAGNVKMLEHIGKAYLGQDTKSDVNLELPTINLNYKLDESDSKS